MINRCTNAHFSSTPLLLYSVCYRAFILITMEKEFEVWTEGYAATGESGGATFHGKFKGETFKDAVIAWKNTLTDEYSIKCVDIDRMCFWGCRFFDNERDARKSFG